MAREKQSTNWPLAKFYFMVDFGIATDTDILECSACFSNKLGVNYS